ncbi:hypothetical protein DPMN_104908 [Dreissena polymorpha]|uniref:Uncharacterized protein n=1 Tax=Dreissena polymorpha TaxID=45954 RepID=A0A9D4HAL9_DREPO|nr:hypothetical protein DPMN_104908 [Dreissena polymorpha]
MKLANLPRMYLALVPFAAEIEINMCNELYKNEKVSRLKRKCIAEDIYGYLLLHECGVASRFIFGAAELVTVASAAPRHDGGSPANAVLGIGSLSYGNRKDV